MKRLKKYLGLPLSMGQVRDAETLQGLGFVCRYLPNPPEDFDEFEFVTDFKGTKNLGLMVTVEGMRIKRAFFGFISPEDPDVVTALSESQLEDFLNREGDRVLRFFDYITQ